MTTRTTADEYRLATFWFESKAYAEAARMLEGVLAEEPANLSVRLLLARSYYHSAQLTRAESQLRRILDADPAEDYARLMLGRTLERQGRAEEARPHLRLAAAMTGAELP
ncbi:tetratricopeptide repeat protein [Kitasatospora sp. NPDC004240]